MAKVVACSKCGSPDVITGAVLQPDGHGGHVLAWKGSLRSPVTASVCGKCGNVELSATNPEAFLPAKKK